MSQEKRKISRELFEPKKVVNGKKEVSKVDKKETIKNIRATKKGRNHPCHKLHKKTGVQLIKIAKEVGAEVVQKKPKASEKSTKQKKNYHEE